MVAANLASLGVRDLGDEGVSFVAEGDRRKADVWVYASAEQEVCVELPTRLSGNASLAFDDGSLVEATVMQRLVRFRLPARPGRTRIAPPSELAATPPVKWPGGTPAIGIVDIEGMHPTWTRIAPADWLDAFRRSRLATELGVPIKRITSAKALAAALEASPTRWLAIINPYGESFPATGAGKWQAMLDRIRRYVNHGGCWWETGGYSFYAAAWPGGSQHVGSSGMDHLGLPVGGGDVDQPPEPLAVPPEGRAWLGDKLSARVASLSSAVNRGPVRGSHDPGHVTLVAGARQDFVGGYRLDGWGWLWRIGGFHPNPDVAVPVAIAAIEHIATHPPVQVKAGRIRYLWHATVTKR